MSPIDRQTVRECIEATRVHERALNDYMRGRRLPSAIADVADGLAITATKLEKILSREWEQK